MQNKCVSEYKGVACALSCILEMVSWLEGGPSSWTSCGATPVCGESTPSALEYLDDEVELRAQCASDPEDEAEATELIRIATEEACSVAAERRKQGRSGNSTDTKSAKSSSIVTSDASRGVWKYVVGLVGKPSAGKVAPYCMICSRIGSYIYYNLLLYSLHSITL